FGIICIANDNHEIARSIQTSCRAIQANYAGTACASDGISLQADSIINIDDLHFFIRVDIGGVQQILIDGDTSDVVEFCLGDGRAMNLSLAHGTHHSDDIPFTNSKTWY